MQKAYVCNKRRDYEAFKRPTAGEIFPYDLTYRIANESWRSTVLFVLLPQTAHRSPRVCRKRIRTMGGVSALSAHYHRIQRALD